MISKTNTPIWVKIKESEYGNYVDENGVRYILETCVAIFHPKKLTPQQLGWTQYADEEAALLANGLTTYVNPDEEELENELVTPMNSEEDTEMI